MELSQRFVGTPLRSRSTTVNWRDTMNYAAAVDDGNPIYFDDTRGAGIMAPPMFCVALTWPIAGRLGEYIESHEFPAEVIPTQVHYTEHIRMHRPLLPGDQLTISGRIAAIRPHRAGTHAIIRFDAADEKNNPVFTEHLGGLMRGVKCIGDAAAPADVPEIPRHPENSENPQWQWSRDLFIDPLLPYVYDGCTSIFFPIHTSMSFARSVGLPGIILQGTATLALAVRELTNAFAGGDPSKIRAIACRFTHMVTPGTHMTINAAETPDNGTVQFAVANKDGHRAISDGCVML